MSMKRCLEAGCGAIGPWGRQGRCEAHRLAIQRMRDRTPQRRAQKAKYDHNHERTREAWAVIISQGISVHCWRCGALINPSRPWDLGHRKGLPSHPEHPRCNRSAK